MRPGSRRGVVIRVSFGLMWAVAGAVLASDTNVFNAINTLQGAAIISDGIQQVRFRSDPGLILGNNAGSLAIAVMDADCAETGLRPTVRMVALNGSTIVAPLVEFTEMVSV